jgi:hypothetical protein
LIALQKKKLLDRWIELSELDLESYKKYEQFPREALTKRLYSVINDENIQKCVKIGGLPYTVCKHEII